MEMPSGQRSRKTDPPPPTRTQQSPQDLPAHGGRQQGMGMLAEGQQAGEGLKAGACGGPVLRSALQALVYQASHLQMPGGQACVGDTPDELGTIGDMDWGIAAQQIATSCAAMGGEAIEGCLIKKTAANLIQLRGSHLLWCLHWSTDGPQVAPDRNLMGDHL